MTRGHEATEAPLLPKVRGQFAEFLDRGSLVTLGEFPQPTGVGLRYGRTGVWREAFLDGLGIGDFRLLAQTRPPHQASDLRLFLEIAL